MQTESIFSRNHVTRIIGHTGLAALMTAVLATAAAGCDVAPGEDVPVGTESATQALRATSETAVADMDKTPAATREKGELVVTKEGKRGRIMSSSASRLVVSLDEQGGDVVVIDGPVAAKSMSDWVDLAIKVWGILTDGGGGGGGGGGGTKCTVKVTVLPGGTIVLEQVCGPA
jgi:hypothetical protein